MPKTFGLRGIVVAFGAVMLVGCSADSTEDGPGDGPAANEPAPPMRPAPPAAPGTPTPPPSTGSSGSPATPAPDGVIARGEFVNKDHKGSGTALMVAAADGTKFLRLENITVDAGPALHVLLTKEPSPSGRADVEKGSLDLGVLRATKGNLTYPIPAGTDVKAYAGVVVYCADYFVVFTAATFGP